MLRLRAAGDRIAALPVLPALAVLIALQLAQAFWFAFSTPHNGWIWDSGGDATEYWTQQFAVGHHFLGQPIIGYALPVYYAWVPLVAGPSLLSGAVVIVLFQAIVLVPLALVLFWLVADRLFGRVYAWFAAALWVAGPLLLLHGFVGRYHPVFKQFFLVPHWFGFTNMADLPSLVAVLGCAWFALRWFDEDSATDAVIGGLLAGLTIGLKPSNGFFIVALLVLVVGARRPRSALLWAAGIAPALLTLAIWKVRGLGYLPLTSSSYEKLHVAAGAATPVAFTTSKYVQFDWGHLQQELIDLREVFWSLRFLEFLLFAGAFGVIRKHLLKGLFVVVWFAGYGLFKGSSTHSDFTSANWFRLAEPALPAYILLVVGVAYCLPVLGRRLAAAAPLTGSLHVDRRRVAIAAVLLGLIPLVVVGTASPASTQRIARDNRTVNEAPISKTFDLRAKVHGHAVTLTWKSTATGGVKVLYEVYRSHGNNGCDKPSSGANECILRADYAARVTSTQITLQISRTTTYRVGMLAGYQRSAARGDLMLLSDPVRVRVH